MKICKKSYVEEMSALRRKRTVHKISINYIGLMSMVNLLCGDDFSAGKDEK